LGFEIRDDDKQFRVLFNADVTSHKDHRYNGRDKIVSDNRTLVDHGLYLPFNAPEIVEAERQFHRDWNANRERGIETAPYQLVLAVCEGAAAYLGLQARMRELSASRL
jgi:hypothetical protein